MIKYLIQRALHTRKIHVFCIGAAKTGTTSVAAMIGAGYRSLHEPEVGASTELVMNYCAEKITESDCVRRLRARDRRLYLDVESSHPLGYLVRPLQRAFPEAKFIVTVREPLAWLRSRLDFHHARKPSEWDKYRKFLWSRWHCDYSPYEAILQQRGLYPLDAYLKQYTEQYKIIQSNLAPANRIIVKTELLDSSVSDISRFLRIPESAITPQRSNVLDEKSNILDELDPSFVAEKIEQNCADWYPTFERAAV